MIKYLSFRIVLLCIIFFTITLQAQSIFLRPNDQVYDFLEKLSVKKVIYIDDEVKPFSRIQVAGYLKKIKKISFILSNLEKKELQYYLEEYDFELKDRRISERYYLASYQDKDFNFAFSPLGGYGVSSIGKNNGHTRFIGIKAFGTYSDWFGAYIHFTDIGIFGNSLDDNKPFLLNPHTGYAFIGAPNGIEFTDIIGGITFDWKWGNIGLLKDYNEWGHGKFGNLIMSNKAASFPHIRLELKPTEWFRFYFFHGWLNSLVIDSSTIRFQSPGTLLDFKRKDFIPKYIAANLFTFNLYDYVDFSIGNSFVYSGRLRPEMFIPFMFYKLLDRDIGQGGIGDGNGQLYLDLSLKKYNNFQIYGTFFIDDLSIRKTLQGDFHENWLGYTFGGKIVDYPIKNSSINIEYTKIDPWIYEHKDITTTYKHIGYNLGHWIGQNADQIKIQFNYYFSRSLKASIFAERIRKGGLKDIYYAYKTTEIQPFLYNPVRKDYLYGLNVTYNPLHDVFLRGKFQFSDISDEDITRTPSFLLGKHFSFNVSLSYGM